MGRKKGFILSNVMMVFEILSTLLLTPFLIRTLGQAEYGVYKLAASITAYLLLLDLGVGNAIIRYIAKYRANKDADSERKFFGVATVFYFAIAVISVVGGFVLMGAFPRFFSEGLTAEEIALGQKLLFFTTLNAAVTMGTSVYANVISAYERYAVSKGNAILQVILRILLAFGVLKLGFGSIGVVVVDLLLTVLCRGFFLLYVLFGIKLRPTFRGIQFAFIKEIVVYSGWILVQMIATQITTSMNQILLGAFVSGSATIIAVYGVGTQLVQYFRSIGSSFTGVLMPGVVRLVENGADGKALCNEMVRIGRLIFMMLGLILGGFAVFGREFVSLWAGAVNADAFLVALLLMGAYLLISTEAIGTQILWAKNEHKEQSLLKLGIVLLNIVLTVVLIKWKPLMGAALGTFIALVVGDIVVMNVLFAKKLKISLFQYYKGLFKGTLVSLIVSTAVGFVINLIPLAGWLGLALKIAMMCAVYACSLWLFGMNRYEKGIVLSLLKVKKKKNKA